MTQRIWSRTQVVDFKGMGRVLHGAVDASKLTEECVASLRELGLIVITHRGVLHLAGAERDTACGAVS